MSEERTTYKVEFDLDKFRARLERQGAIAFDDVEFLIDELAAAHERANNAETAQRAWTELGAREQAGAAVLRSACEAVMYFWGKDPEAFGDWASVTSLAGRFAATADRVRAALDATDAGKTLLPEIEAARALAAKLNDQRQHYGTCHVCGFGAKLDGSEFHGTGCPLAAYNDAVKARDA